MCEKLIKMKEEFSALRRMTMEKTEFEHDIEVIIQCEDM